MWKGSGIVKRSSYLGASVICICMAGFAALRSYVTMPYLSPTSLAQLCVVTRVSWMTSRQVMGKLKKFIYRITCSGKFSVCSEALNPIHIRMFRSFSTWHIIHARSVWYPCFRLSGRLLTSCSSQLNIPTVLIN